MAGVHVNTSRGDRIGEFALHVCRVRRTDPTFGSPGQEPSFKGHPKQGAGACT